MFNLGRMRKGGSRARDDARDLEVDVAFEEDEGPPSAGESATIAHAREARASEPPTDSPPLEDLDYEGDPDTVPPNTDRRGHPQDAYDPRRDARVVERATLPGAFRENARPTRNTSALVAGRYQLLSLLGEGGMGAVYEAEHVELGKRVAVKLLNFVAGTHDELVARFKQEARSVSALEDDHIVQVFDAGEDPEHGLFMVMERLRGEDLEHVLLSRGRLGFRFACGIIYQVCLGLESAHARRLVHRDLKPANIFLAQARGDGVRVKIVDFGLAKVLAEASGTTRGALTRAGVTLGTPEYMAPEQALALDGVDERVDIYALGAVLYEAIVGEPLVPHYNHYERTIVHITTVPPPRMSELVPEVPRALDDLVASMLAPLASRIGSVHAVRQQLVAIYPEVDGIRLSLPPLGARSGSVPVRRDASDRPLPPVIANLSLPPPASPAPDPSRSAPAPTLSEAMLAARFAHATILAWIVAGLLAIVLGITLIVLRR
jgi:serine/threonine-protein kinase